MSDFEAIHALIGAYLEAADRGRSSELAGLFAPDGVLEIIGDTFDAGVHRGPEAIVERLEASRRDLAARAHVPLLRHHVSSIRITVEGDSARGASYFLALTDTGPDHWGRYADRYVRAGAGWRFAHRRVFHEGRAAGSWIRSPGPAPRS
jgi:ketosteroid isomerase-like protein